MTQEELSQLSDDELLAEAKKIQWVRIQYALIIGFLIGIIIYSVAMNTWGFLTLIPLYFIYKLIQNPNHDHKAVDKLLKERNLK